VAVSLPADLNWPTEYIATAHCRPSSQNMPFAWAAFSDRRFPATHPNVLWPRACLSNRNLAWTYDNARINVGRELA